MFHNFSKKLAFAVIILSLSNAIVAADNTSYFFNNLPNPTQVRASVLDLIKIVTDLSEVNGLNSKEIAELAQRMTAIENNNQMLSQELKALVAEIATYKNIVRKSLYAAAIVAGTYGAWKLGWWIKGKLDAKKQQTIKKSPKIV